MTNILEITGVEKRFGGVVANHDVSLSVPAGSICGLIGPNGSGKTTLFNAIAGTIPIDGGKILFQGREISKLRTPGIARLGLIRTYQQTRVYDGMSCVDNMLISASHRDETLLSIFSRVSPTLIDEAEELLRFVGLAEKRRLRAGTLSFGQRKLLELAMALMNRPTLLLLDEPTAGINPTLINGLIGLLKTINREFNVTLLVIEHNMHVIMSLAEEMTCLAHGEVLARGSPDDIRANPRVIDAYLGAH